MRKIFWMFNFGFRMFDFGFIFTCFSNKKGVLLSQNTLYFLISKSEIENPNSEIKLLRYN
jgi:hypothetical protein